MTNSEIKKQKWQEISDKYKHLETYCKIELQEIEDDSEYYHPKFILDENTYISSQGDCQYNYLYAFVFHSTIEEEYYSTDIYSEALDKVIIGWLTNKETVLLALKTLSKIKSHIRELDSYASDYINSVLLSNSVKDVTERFINEIRVTSDVISFMQNKLKKQ